MRVVVDGNWVLSSVTSSRRRNGWSVVALEEAAAEGVEQHDADASLPSGEQSLDVEGDVGKRAHARTHATA